jgi:hypothetical protein
MNSTINQNRWIALAKLVEINRTFAFHPFLETIPPLALTMFRTQLTVSEDLGLFCLCQNEGGHHVDSYLKICVDCLHHP